MRVLRFVLAVIAVVLTAPVAMAQDSSSGDNNRLFEPGIWVDPDGCSHWVMDDGAEGYMSPILKRNGDPVCHRGEVCGIVPTDQLFATDRSGISSAGRARLRQFFKDANAFGYLIYGHTDSRASDSYNRRLSDRRAAAVASIARDVGARVVDVKGFGEHRPRATNSTAAGMQQNRRVEIYCLR